MSRMSRTRFGLALEAEELVAEIIEPQDSDSQIDKDLLEINNSENEVNLNEDKVNSASDVVEALESMRDLMAISADNGGMDRYSASIVSVAVGHMYSTVGIKASSMPSLESFNDPENCTYSTKMVMEGIVEGISKIWKIIIEAIRKSIQWVKDFFSKIFGTNKKIEERAKEILVKVKEQEKEPIKEEEKEPVNENGYHEKEYADLRAEAKRRMAERDKDKPKHFTEISFVDNALFLNIQIDGVVPKNFYTIFSDIHSLALMVFDYNNLYNNHNNIKYFDEDFKKYIDQKNVDKYSAEALINKLDIDKPPDFSYWCAANNKKHKNEIEEIPEMDTITTKTFLGNKYLSCVRPSKAIRGEDVIRLLPQIDFKLETYHSKNSPSGEKRIPVIDPEDIVETIGEITEMCALINNLEREFSESILIKDRFLAYAVNIDTGRTTFEDENETKSKLAKLLKAYLFLIDKPLILFLPYVAHTCNVVLDYIEKSAAAVIKN